MLRRKPEDCDIYANVKDFGASNCDRVETTGRRFRKGAAGL